jgi:hypothetical protein
VFKDQAHSHWGCSAGVCHRRAAEMSGRCMAMHGGIANSDLRSVSGRGEEEHRTRGGGSL